MQHSKKSLVRSAHDTSSLLHHQLRKAKGQCNIPKNHLYDQHTTLLLFFPFQLGIPDIVSYWSSLFSSALASLLSSAKMFLISSGDLPLINVAILAQPKCNREGKSI